MASLRRFPNKTGLFALFFEFYLDRAEVTEGELLLVKVPLLATGAILEERGVMFLPLDILDDYLFGMSESEGATDNCLLGFRSYDDCSSTLEPAATTSAFPFNDYRTLNPPMEEVLF